MTDSSQFPVRNLAGSFSIETPEQVSFRLERAGLGSRIMAGLIDAVILMVVYMITATGLFAFGIGVVVEYLNSSMWYVGLAIFFLTFLFWAYYIVFESVWNGQTPGKRWTGLRVVGDQGTPAGFNQILIRNLLRILDGQVGYAIAIVSIFMNGEEKRLGDLAAGTIVVRERSARPTPAARNAKPAARQIDPQLLQLVGEWEHRSAGMSRRARWHVAHRLANALAQARGRDAVSRQDAERTLHEITTELFEAAPATEVFAKPV